MTEIIAALQFVAALTRVEFDLEALIGDATTGLTVKLTAWREVTVSKGPSYKVPCATLQGLTPAELLAKGVTSDMIVRESHFAQEELIGRHIEAYGLIDGVLALQAGGDPDLV